jgi:hypothetical protein
LLGFTFAGTNAGANCRQCCRILFVGCNLRHVAA